MKPLPGLLFRAYQPKGETLKYSRLFKYAFPSDLISLQLKVVSTVIKTAIFFPKLNRRLAWDTSQDSVPLSHSTTSILHKQQMWVYCILINLSLRLVLFFVLNSVYDYQNTNTFLYSRPNLVQCSYPLFYKQDVTDVWPMTESQLAQFCP